MPKFVLIAAITLDGKIAKNSRHPSDWTSPEDKVYMRMLLKKSDIVIVGNNTFESAKKPLSKRRCLVFTSKVRGIKKVSENLIYFNPEKSNIKNLLKTLGIKTAAVLGGMHVYDYFLEKNLIDDLYLTIEPLAFGKGLGLFDTAKPLTKRFKLKELRKLNNAGSILLHYK